MAKFETEVGLPCRNPRYTTDGKHGEEFPPVNARWGFWQQAMSMGSGHPLADCGDIKNGWILSLLIWIEQPKKYSLEEPLIVETPTGVRLISHASRKTEDERTDRVIVSPTSDGGTTNSRFSGFTENAEPVLFNQQAPSLSTGGIQIPNSSTTVKNPA